MPTANCLILSRFCAFWLRTKRPIARSASSPINTRNVQLSGKLFEQSSPACGLLSFRREAFGEPAFCTRRSPLNVTKGIDLRMVGAQLWMETPSRSKGSSVLTLTYLQKAGRLPVGQQSDL